MKQRLKKIYSKDGQDRLLPKFSLFIFDRSRTMAILWLCLTVFGAVSYTSLLKREGFPSVNIPYTVISGAYLVNDPGRVDKDVAKPISDIVLKDGRVKTVQTTSRGTFYSVVIQYKGDDIKADPIGKELEGRIKDANVLPKQVSMKVESPKFGFTTRGDDAVVTLYAKEKGATQKDLMHEAEHVVAFIKSKHLKDQGLESISVVDPFVHGKDPITGKDADSQTSFDRYAVRRGNENKFYDSVAIGIMQKDGTDVIKLDDRIQEAIAEYNNQRPDSKFQAVASASYAHDIKDQISELQRALLEGLVAILLVGSLVIAIRASLVTVLSMMTVLAITVGMLYVIGYTLNTITLFSLILCLGLIVDDTIIMVEAIDAQRRRRTDRREVVKVATQKVSRAMVAATSTAVLSFAPLLFVGGILGNFIRAIPVTVISSLVVSLLVALVFIPLFARYLLLGKKQMGAKNVHEPAARVEAKVAAFVGKPMLWARHSRKKLFGVGLTAVTIGVGFILAAGFLMQKVTFNIFPPAKDSNTLMVQMNFAPGTTIGQAEKVADKANHILADDLDDNFKYASYYANAGSQNASLMVYIKPYDERKITAPELEQRLDKKFENFKEAKVDVSQADMGPPAAAFSVHLKTENREAGMRLAEDISAFLQKEELKRPSGEKAKVKEVTVADPDTYTRDDGAQYIGVTASFKDKDTTTLVTLAQDAVKKEFNESKLRSYGLDKNALQFDIGQEEENQDSFKTLVMAFPILLLVIYLLLALQFRSLAQPLLIFMAIPFSLFGITLGLFITDNAFSFFAMLGFFALIGLSIKNTILLTDFANQLRRTGVPVVDAAVGALEERFRPLIATSLTAAISLIPLAISSPFWEGLAVVLIGGLLSSTFLVITVFPYYYLGAEFVRLHISRKAGLSWLVLTILAVVVTNLTLSGGAIPLAIILVPILQMLFVKFVLNKRRRA